MQVEAAETTIESSLPTVATFNSALQMSTYCRFGSAQRTNKLHRVKKQVAPHAILVRADNSNDGKHLNHCADSQDVSLIFDLLGMNIPDTGVSDILKDGVIAFNRAK